MNEKFLLITDLSNKMQAGGVKSHTLQVLNFLEEHSIPCDICIETDSDDSEFVRNLQNNYTTIIISHRPKILNNNVLGFIFDIYMTLKLKSYKKNKVLINTGDVSKYWAFGGGKWTKCYHFLHSLYSKPQQKRNIISRIFRKKNNIITVSHYAKNILQSNALLKSVNVIHNFVNDKENFHEQSNQEITVMTVGQLVKYKGVHDWLDVAIEVCKIRSNINFIWLGDGPLELVIPNEYKNNIHFLGFHSDLGKFYQSSDIYYHPSHIENHSLSIIDAMSYGLPSVVCDVGGNSESIENMYSGIIVEKKDIKSHIQSLLNLIDDPVLRRNLSQNAINTQRNKFSRDAWNKQMKRELGIK